MTVRPERLWLYFTPSIPAWCLSLSRSRIAVSLLLPHDMAGDLAGPPSITKGKIEVLDLQRAVTQVKINMPSRFIVRVSGGGDFSVGQLSIRCDKNISYPSCGVSIRERGPFPDYYAYCNVNALRNMKSCWQVHTFEVMGMNTRIDPRCRQLMEIVLTQTASQIGGHVLDRQLVAKVISLAIKVA
jgi:hypothetical protein